MITYKMPLGSVALTSITDRFLMREVAEQVERDGYRVSDSYTSRDDGWYADVGLTNDELSGSPEAVYGTAKARLLAGWDEIKGMLPEGQKAVALRIRPWQHNDGLTWTTLNIHPGLDDG